MVVQPPPELRPRLQYTTTTQNSAVDVIGTELAKFAVHAIAGGLKQVNPGLTPGVDATVFGIDRSLDHDLAQRSVQTTSRIVYDAIPAAPRYEVRSYD